MYWIYLIILSVVVFIPSIVEKGRFGLSLIQTQEYALLIIGIVTFIIMNLREKRFEKNLQEKLKMASQVNKLSKEMTHSYSYIGEINRKMDILKDVATGFPETSEFPIKRRMEIYNSIMSAIYMLSRSNDFVLRFVNEKSHEVLTELKSKGITDGVFLRKECPSSGYFFENEEIIFARSPKAIDNIYSCIIIRKKVSMNRTEDPELLKSLAMHALFLFMLVQEKRYRVKDVEKISH